MDRNYDAIKFILNTIILRSPKVAKFVDVINILTMFTKTTFKDSENDTLKCNLYLYFLI